MHRTFHITRHLKVIRNACRFWFSLSLVFTVQCSKLVMRCSHFNAALSLRGFISNDG